MALGLAVAALILAVIGVASSVMTAGNAELNVAAVCFCSFLIAIAGLVILRKNVLIKPVVPVL